jgi:hypothetical protein
MHIAIPHNHYTKSDAKHSIEHNEVTSIVDLLGLAFHNGNEKDLKESNQVSYEALDLAADELTVSPLIITEVAELEQSSDSQYYLQVFIRHYKHFYPNNLPLRGPPKVII